MHMPPGGSVRISPAGGALREEEEIFSDAKKEVMFAPDLLFNEYH